MTTNEIDMLIKALRNNSYNGMDNVRQAIHNDYCYTVAETIKKTNTSLDVNWFVHCCGGVPHA